MSRVTDWSIFAVGLSVSVVLTYFFGGLYIFLVLPFFYFPLRNPATKVCPECGLESVHPSAVYCQVDGARLERK